MWGFGKFLSSFILPRPKPVNPELRDLALFIYTHTYIYIYPRLPNIRPQEFNAQVQFRLSAQSRSSGPTSAFVDTPNQRPSVGVEGAATPKHLEHQVLK